MNNKNQKSNKIKRILRLLLGGILLKIATCIFRKRKDVACNLKDFVKEEKREINELRTGKESFKKYCCDSYSLFHVYFIPSHKNEHKPKILRPRSLAVIAIASTMLKVFVVGYLFLIYPNQAAMTEIITKKVFELTNIDRVQNNLNALTMNTVLSASASAKANDMITNNYFAHHSPTGKKPWDWISRADYPYIFVGENLAMNFTSAGAVHTALMNSPTHKKNIMNDRYNEMGLSMVSGQIDGKNTNVLVELFATTGNTVSLASAPAKIEQVKAPVEEEKPQVVETSVLASEKKIEEPKPVVQPVAEPVVKPVVVRPEPVKEVIAIKPTAPVTTTSMREEKELMPTERIAEPVGRVIEAEEQTVSPNAELEYNPNARVVYISPEEDRRFGFATSLVKGSQYIYLGLLAMMIIMFMVNIMVRFTVQHKPVIFQTLFVILFIFSLASVKIHMLESLVSGIAIL